MKKITKYMAAVLMMSVLALPAAAGAAAQETSTLHVTGYAEQEVVPDMCYLTLGIEEAAETLEEAQRNAGLVMNSLSDSLQALGVAGSDLQTTSFYVNPVYDKNDNTSISGYKLTHVLKVKLAKLDLLPQVINTAKNCGINKINGLQFGYAQAGSLKSKLLQQAIKNGKSLAETAASGAGVRLGKLKEMYISNSNYDYSTNGNTMLLSRKAGDEVLPKLEIGTKKISESVDLVYYLQ